MKSKRLYRLTRRTEGPEVAIYTIKIMRSTARENYIYVMQTKILSYK